MRVCHRKLYEVMVDENIASKSQFHPSILCSVNANYLLLWQLTIWCADTGDLESNWKVERRHNFVIICLLVVPQQISSAVCWFQPLTLTFLEPALQMASSSLSCSSKSCFPIFVKYDKLNFSLLVPPDLGLVAMPSNYLWWTSMFLFSSQFYSYNRCVTCCQMKYILSKYYHVFSFLANTVSIT